MPRRWESSADGIIIRLKQRALFQRYRSKADIAASPTNVRFTPESGHQKPSGICRSSSGNRATPSHAFRTSPGSLAILLTILRAYVTFHTNLLRAGVNDKF